jgi:outer membrane protein assembly factor BamB
MRQGTRISLAPSVGAFANDIPQPGGGPIVLYPGSLVQPANGVLDIDPNTGAIYYTPNPSFTGVDTGSYQAWDGSDPHTISNIAYVSFTVQAYTPPAGGLDVLLSSPWPKIHQGVFNQGVNSGASVITSPTLRWMASVGSQVWGSVVIDSASPTPAVYVTADGSLNKLNAYTGAPIWQQSLSSPSRGSPTLGASGNVYHGTNDGKFQSRTMATGAANWTYSIGPTPYSVWSSPTMPEIPAAGQPFVYFGSDQHWTGERSEGRAYGMNVGGGLLWETYLAGPNRSSPVFFPFDSDTLAVAYTSHGGIVNGYNGTLTVLDASTGEPLWEREFPLRIEAAPVYLVSQLGGVLGVLAVSYDGTARLYGTGGGLAWQVDLDASIQSAPAYNSVTDTLFFTDEEGKVTALVGSTGAALWQNNLATGAIQSSPALVGSGTASSIYVASNDGVVSCISQTTGLLAWAFPLPSEGTVKWSSPAVGADGTIYVGSINNNVYAIFQGSGMSPGGGGGGAQSDSSRWVSGLAQSFRLDGSGVALLSGLDKANAVAADLASYRTWRITVTGKSNLAPMVFTTAQYTDAPGTTFFWFVGSNYIYAKESEVAAKYGGTTLTTAQRREVDLLFEDIGKNPSLLEAMFQTQPTKKGWRLADWKQYRTS